MSRAPTVRVELIAAQSESDGDEHCDTALASCCVDCQPGARANCSSDRRNPECVGKTARAAFLLVRVAQRRGEGAECRSTDDGADDRAVSEGIARSEGLLSEGAVHHMASEPLEWPNVC